MKIYRVTFNEYNYSYDGVLNNDGTVYPGKIGYLSTGNKPYLITEHQICGIADFGGGIKTLEFVGNLCTELPIE